MRRRKDTSICGFLRADLSVARRTVCRLVRFGIYDARLRIHNTLLRFENSRFLAGHDDSADSSGVLDRNVDAAVVYPRSAGRVWCWWVVGFVMVVGRRRPFFFWGAGCFRFLSQFLLKHGCSLFHPMMRVSSYCERRSCPQMQAGNGSNSGGVPT